MVFQWVLLISIQCTLPPFLSKSDMFEGLFKFESDTEIKFDWQNDGQ